MTDISAKHGILPKDGTADEPQRGADQDRWGEGEQGATRWQEQRQRDRGEEAAETGLEIEKEEETQKGQTARRRVRIGTGGRMHGTARSAGEKPHQGQGEKR